MANSMDAAPAGSGSMREPIVLDDAGNLVAPKNIITTAVAARALYYKARSQHLPRIDLYAMIEGLIAGNPPYNPADLQTHGLSHIANFNNGDGRAFYERAALAYWNLLNASEYICAFKIKGEPGRSPQKTEWEDILNEKWDEMVRDWENFERQVNTLTAQIVKFGYSPACWTDEYDWRWKTIEVARFFVPDQASTDLAQLTYLFVESNFTAQYLWNVYETLIKQGVQKGTKPTKEQPWDIDALERFLLYRANAFLKQDTGAPPMDMMALQQRLQNRDLLYDAIFSDEIRLVTMLYQEYGGKVTSAIFDRTYELDFLYHATELYDKLSDMLVLFTASPGEFTIHANRGVGHKIFSPCQATMQIDCDMVNMVRLGSVPMIRTLNTGAQDFSPIRIIPGSVTNIGSAELVQNNLAANIQPVVGVGQYILQKLNINAANSGDDPGMPDRNQGSVAANQAKMKAIKEFGMMKHNVAHFYVRMDRVWKNMLYRALNSKPVYPGYDSVKKFKDACLMEGLPPLLFDLDEDGYPKYLGIRSTRVGGDGSQVGTIMSLESFAPLVSTLPEKGVKEYQRRAVIAYFGKEDLPAFLPEDAVPDEQAGGSSLAAVENAIMRQGEMPVFSRENDQRAHIGSHIAFGTWIIQSLQQQRIDPIQANRMFEMLIPHGGEHIQFISTNPLEKQFFDQVEKPWNQIAEYARLNKKNAEEMLKAQIRKAEEDQQKTQQVMSDEQRKDFQAQRNEMRADFKVRSQVARAAEANQTRAEVQREKVRSDADNKRLQIALEDRNERSKIANETATAAREELAQLNGVTPSVSDFEGNVS